MHPTDHGRRACYQHGCRQPDCVTANRLYVAAHQRRRRHLLTSVDDVWVPFLPAGPVRQHIRQLAELGIGLSQIAARSGVSYRTLHVLMVGDPTRRRARTRTVTPRVANAVLAVTAGDGRRLIPAEYTAALLAELAAAGVSRAQIARHVGRTDLRLGARIDAQIAQAVADLHRLLLAAA